MREDWVILQWNDVLDIKNGKHYKNVINVNGKYPIYGSAGIINYADEYLCMENSTIIGRKGTINKPLFVKEKFWNIDTAFGIEVKQIILNPKYLYYFALNFNFMKLNQATAIPSLTKRNLLKIAIPISPLLEQKAIVSKIEQLFSELDNGVENLKTAQQKLKIYRQAVLKKAFEGELTKVWREKKSNLPTASELLEEIKKERNIWIENEIANNSSEAKRLKNKLKKLEFKIPNENIPTSWKWTSFLESAHLVVDCHNKTAPYVDNGIYLIRTSNIRNGKFDFDNKMKFVNDETYHYWSRRCPPGSGDILFTREAPMGEAAIIPKNTKVCMGQRIMLIRVFKHLLNEKYLLYAILDSKFQQRFGNTAIGTGVKHLRVGDVEKLVFPLCSVLEQTQIVQEIESRLSVCDNIETTLTDALQKSEALRHSILKKAFEGKLLTEKELEDIKNNPEYESAEKLLERIKQERKDG